MPAFNRSHGAYKSNFAAYKNHIGLDLLSTAHENLKEDFKAFKTSR